MISVESNRRATTSAVNLAFSKQSTQFDQLDQENIILQDLRRQVYRHVSKFLKPKSKILELNAGTGIDALHFCLQGHTVLATDLADGMIEQIEKKIQTHCLHGQLTCQQLSYENLSLIDDRSFDFVFSNFGGLNCTHDLDLISKGVSSLLRKGGIVTWVIMPPVCPTEMLGVIRGNLRFAFRRFRKGGVKSHLEGYYFQTYYHSLSQIKKALGHRFELLDAESLALFSPQPHSGLLALKYPRLYRLARMVDKLFRRTYPFNRWGDHIIVTFRFNG